MRTGRVELRGATILVGDARETWRAAPRVHAVITSPSYWGLRNYLRATDPNKALELGQEASPAAFAQALVEVFRGWRERLHSTGSLVLNLGDSYATGAGAGRVLGSGRPQRLLDAGALARQANRGRVEGLKPKDLALVPGEVARALRADGWFLRAEVPWIKLNGMPADASTLRRPVVSHETTYLFQVSPEGFWDAQAVRVPSARPGSHSGNARRTYAQDFGRPDDHFGRGIPWEDDGTGRNRRSSDWWRESLGLLIEEQRAWLEHLEHVRDRGGMLLDPAGEPVAELLPTQPSPFAGEHFAAFPPRFVRPWIEACTSAHGCCGACGAPWERVVEAEGRTARERGYEDGTTPYAAAFPGCSHGLSRRGHHGNNDVKRRRHTGWRPTCTCDAERVPCVVADPFAGTCTTLGEAVRVGRRAFGADLDPRVLTWARRRLAALPPEQLEIAVAEVPHG